MKTTPPKTELDAATAGRVLQTDLANILQKAKSGKPLSKHERALVTTHTTGRPSAAAVQPPGAPEPPAPQTPGAAIIEKWSINRLSEQTGIDRRTLRKILKDTKPCHIEGERHFYTLADFIEALMSRDQKGATALEAERTRLTAHQANIAAVEEARIKNEVIEVESVLRIWSNCALAIRAIIIHSEIPRERQDAILSELKSINVDGLLEQQEFDKEAEPTDESKVPKLTHPN